MRRNIDSTVRFMSILSNYLSKIKYPISKISLIEHGKGTQVPQDVLSLIEKIKDKKYKNKEEVAEEITKSR